MNPRPETKTEPTPLACDLCGSVTVRELYTPKDRLRNTELLFGIAECSNQSLKLKLLTNSSSRLGHVLFYSSLPFIKPFDGVLSAAGKGATLTLAARSVMPLMVSMSAQAGIDPNPALPHCSSADRSSPALRSHRKQKRQAFFQAT